MNIFDKIIYNKLAESVLNLTQDKLDPMVFKLNEMGLPILRDAIRVQILHDIDEIRKILPVVNFLLIGSILTKNYDENTDIDVTVQVDAELVDNISTAEIMHLLKYLNGNLASDTTHPINYYIIPHEYDDTKADAIYDIVNDRWLKTPKSYEPDIEKWNVKFQDTLKSIDIATGEIRRDLIDIDELKSMDTKNIKKIKLLMKQKLSQLEEMLTMLLNTYKNSKMLRKLAFDTFMSPQEIQTYGSKNQLPENILYKLLEKYYYIRFIKKIESILDEKGELELSDVPKIKQIMGDLWKTS
jgi:predicted nucleotidyltransferase